MTGRTASLGRTLPADRFHSGVRLAALGLWIAAVVVVYLILGVLVDALIGPVAGAGTLLVIVLAVFLAQPLAWLAERQLLARWPSGRAAELAPGALIWRERGRLIHFDLSQTLNAWRWRFTIRRRRGGRVPSGHHCLAIRLAQGEQVVSLYTFAAPAVTEGLTARYAFYELRPSNDKDKPALGGRDAQYLTAENDRWEAGAELDPGDFEALLDHLAAHIPEFARAPAAGLLP